MVETELFDDSLAVVDSGEFDRLGVLIGNAEDAIHIRIQGNRTRETINDFDGHNSSLRNRSNLQSDVIAFLQFGVATKSRVVGNVVKGTDNVFTADGNIGLQIAG